MQDLLTEYLLDATERVGWSEKTIKAYGSHLRQFLAWYQARHGGEIVPASYTAEILQTYDTSRKRAHKAQRTRAAAVSAMQSWARWLGRTGRISHDQCERIQEDLHVKVTERPKQSWATTQQVQDLFAACSVVSDHHSDAMAYREHLCAGVLAVMAYAGLRRGEVCNLKVEDVNLLAATPEVTVKHGKGNKTRVVWLHPAAARYLKVWLEHKPIDNENLFAVPVYRPHVAPEVAAMTEHRLIGILRELCRLAGIKDSKPLAPHAFRRFAATKLLEVPGCTLRHVMEFLGHSSIKTTISYVGLESQQLQKLVSAMQVEQVLPPPHTTTARHGNPKSEVRHAAFRRP